MNIALIKASKIYLLNKYYIYYQEEISDKTEFINNLYPLKFYKQLFKLKKFIEENKLFIPLKETYTNFVKKVCIYYLKNNKEQNIIIYEKFLKKKFQKLGIDNIPSNLISEEFHEKFLNHFYFKHINMINEKFEVNIIKNVNYLFNPKVSVIIPVYNVEKYIIKCLDSIINQKLNEIEIIVVNDGSTDNSLQIVESFAKNNDRILILSQINRGLSEARNTGIKYSKGEYIYFIDGDDYLDDKCLFDLYNEAVTKNLDIIFFDSNSFLDEKIENNETDLIDKYNYFLHYYHRKGNYTGILKGTEMFIKMKKNYEYRTSACLQFIKKEFYIKIGLSFYPGIIHEDNLFSFIAILLANRTIHINKNYYNRRVHENSIMTTSINVKNVYGYFIVYCEILKFLEKNNFKGDVRFEIRNELIANRNRIQRHFNQITQDEKYILFKKFTIYQEIIFKNILEIKQYDIKIKKNEKKIKKLKKIIYYYSIFFFICLLYLLKKKLI